MKEGTGTVLQAVSLLTITLAGFILNSLVLLVFYRRPALRSPSNRFVLSLVVANFVVILGLVPVVLTHLFISYDAPWLPEILNGVHALSVTTSVFSTLAIAVDRYNAVLSPLHYTMTITRQRSRGMIVCVWCVSVFLSTPTFLGVLRRHTHCSAPPMDYDILSLAYTLVLCTVGFTIPLFALMWVYSRMYKAAHRNSERTRRQSLQTTPGDISRGGSLDAPFPPVISTPDVIRTGKPPTLSQIHKRRCSNASISAILFREEGRAVKTAVMVVASFVCAWAPFFIIILLDTLVLVVHVPELFRFLGVFFVVLNTVFSPFIYVYRNEIARNEAVRTLSCWKRGALYKGNVLHQAGKDQESKMADGVIRVRHQTSSNCDSMSVQSFQLPTNYSIECKQCAEIPHAPVADFVATYEVADTPDEGKSSSEGREIRLSETRPKTRGESVTFRLAFLPQRRCQSCIRQNSDSSSGSGYPLLRESESPTPNLSLSGKRHEMISRASSGEESPTFKARCCDSPRTTAPRCEAAEEVILEMEENPASHSSALFQFQETSFEAGRDSWASPEEDKRREPARQDSDVTVDSGVDLGMDRSHSSSSSLSAISPVVSRPKRHRHKLQRLAAVEDEDSLHACSTVRVKFPPCDFG